MPLDLLDRIMIIRTSPYALEEMIQVWIIANALVEALCANNLHCLNLAYLLAYYSLVFTWIDFYQFEFRSSDYPSLFIRIPV